VQVPELDNLNLQLKQVASAARVSLDNIAGYGLAPTWGEKPSRRPFALMTFSAHLEYPFLAPLSSYRETSKLNADLRKVESALKKYTKLKKSPKGDRFEEVLGKFYKGAKEKVDQLLEQVEDARKHAEEVGHWFECVWFSLLYVSRKLRSPSARFSQMFEFYAIKTEDMTGPEELFGIINTFLQDFEVGGTLVVWCAAAWY
jgi:hypothetical protein